LRLVHLIAPASGYDLRGLVGEIDVGRLTKGAGGVFVSENAAPERLDIKIENIGVSNTAGRELVYLAQRENGPIAVEQTGNGLLRPTQSVFPVLFVSQNKTAVTWQHEQRGTAVVAGRYHSIVGRFFSHAFSVLLRESGF
jgi:hypothetical protein